MRHVRSATQRIRQRIRRQRVYVRQRAGAAAYVRRRTYGTARRRTTTQTRIERERYIHFTKLKANDEDGKCYTTRVTTQQDVRRITTHTVDSIQQYACSVDDLRIQRQDRASAFNTATSAEQGPSASWPSRRAKYCGGLGRRCSPSDRFIAAGLFRPFSRNGGLLPILP